MIRDENRDFLENFEGLVRLCGGDADKAEAVRAILNRSYRNERHQMWKHSHYAAVWIGGELVYLKHRLKGRPQREPEGVGVENE
ncbi:MAG: hypothetical protein A2Y33_06335 [Spirochaetes bacterium GWF1_51_8]|nr:MAG: hypothetical protein A2Y33_06335 [Spirochaetes bacterium GWF1_51_8]